MPERFKRHQVQGDRVTSRDLMQVQENAAASIGQLESKPHVVDSVFLEKEPSSTIEGIDLTAGVENLVVHGLGRKFRGWALADIDSNATVYRAWTSTADATKYLPLVPSADCKVKLTVW